MADERHALDNAFDMTWRRSRMGKRLGVSAETQEKLDDAFHAISDVWGEISDARQRRREAQ